jgi:hypothetical protein
LAPLALFLLLVARVSSFVVQLSALVLALANLALEPTGCRLQCPDSISIAQGHLTPRTLTKKETCLLSILELLGLCLEGVSLVLMKWKELKLVAEEPKREACCCCVRLVVLKKNSLGEAIRGSLRSSSLERNQLSHL